MNFLQNSIFITLFTLATTAYATQGRVSVAGVGSTGATATQGRTSVAGAGRDCSCNPSAFPPSLGVRSTGATATQGRTSVAGAGRDCSCNPSAFPPSLGVRSTGATAVPGRTILAAAGDTETTAYSPDSRTAMESFAAEMTRKHGFKAGELKKLLDQIEFHEDIIKAISRPAEAKPWYQYRPIFLKPDRIDGGVKFWRDNEALLQKVQAEYGIPAEIIVAIIGVETRYGRHTGRYRVLDSLATLAFGYPKRARFFRKELEQFLLLSREEQVDPAQAKGSYAGAMGKPQFIASSYRRYAVDYDKDGQRDLWNNNADVIASVANYFKTHGWRAGEPITIPAAMDGCTSAAQPGCPGAAKTGKDLEPFVRAGMKPSIPVTDLVAGGLQLQGEAQPKADALSSLIKLDAGGHDEYWLGLHNFYVITRYNHSNLYAMAAYQLSREILSAREAADGDQ